MLLVILNVPLIGLWVKVLQVPYRYMFPCAMFFIAIGVYSTNNSLFEVNEVLVFGIIGAVFMALDFPVAPILLGYVLGPLVEENFRRAMLLSRGDLTVFFHSNHPISATFLTICFLLVAGQMFFAARAAHRERKAHPAQGAGGRRGGRGVSGAARGRRCALRSMMTGAQLSGCSRNAAVDRRRGGRRPCLARRWLLLHGARPMLEYRAC